MDENYNQSIILKKELKECLYKLLGVLKENNLVVYATENRFVGVDVDSKEAETIKHAFKEHYAIELYKAQKNYKNCLDFPACFISFSV